MTGCCCPTTAPSRAHGCLICPGGFSVYSFWCGYVQSGSEQLKAENWKQRNAMEERGHVQLAWRAVVHWSKTFCCGPKSAISVSRQTPKKYFSRKKATSLNRVSTVCVDPSPTRVLGRIRWPLTFACLPPPRQPSRHRYVSCSQSCRGWSQPHVLLTSAPEKSPNLARRNICTPILRRRGSNRRFSLRLPLGKATAVNMVVT